MVCKQGRGYGQLKKIGGKSRLSFPTWHSRHMLLVLIVGVPLGLAVSVLPEGLGCRLQRGPALEALPLPWQMAMHEAAGRCNPRSMLAWAPLLQVALCRPPRNLQVTIQAEKIIACKELS